ncbi:hypothetical protein QR685DRAFT_451652, partial [Neurospora intermedia]
YYYIYINSIIIASHLVNNYLKHFNVIFLLFILKNIILLPKKSYFGYPNIKFLKFYINGFKLSTINKRI